jgi:hypothetical protein
VFFFFLNLIYDWGSTQVLNYTNVMHPSESDKKRHCTPLKNHKMGILQDIIISNHIGTTYKHMSNYIF